MCGNFDKILAFSHQMIIRKKINPFTPKSAKFKTEEKILNFILKNCQNQTAPLHSTAQ